MIQCFRSGSVSFLTSRSGLDKNEYFMVFRRRYSSFGWIGLDLCLDLEPYNDIHKWKGSVTLLTIIWTCSRYGSRWISSYSSSYEGSNVGTALTVIWGGRSLTSLFRTVTLSCCGWSYLLKLSIHVLAEIYVVYLYHPPPPLLQPHFFAEPKRDVFKAFNLCLILLFLFSISFPPN